MLSRTLPRLETTIVMKWLIPLLFIGVSGFFLPDSLVVNSNGLMRPKRSQKEGNTKFSQMKPQIYQMHVTSHVTNLFSHTTIISKVKNLATQPQETTFSLMLPENAFISGFVMEIDGENYTAYVKEKEEAKEIYKDAVFRGLGAAHVTTSVRDSNRFMVSVNIQPESKTTFHLSYEELLIRKNGNYELVINLHPGQPVKDLSVQVLIAESRKIMDLKAPPIRSGNEIGSDKEELDPRANLQIVNDTTAIVRFSPNIERQKQFAKALGSKEDDGLAGQFVVQYDVERDPHGGEVLIKDGYFVHYFAPFDLPSLPKYVVFVLDTSSSMFYKKIEQLKQGMIKILDELRDIDLFHLVEFNSNVRVWDLDNDTQSVWYPISDRYSRRSSEENVKVENLVFPRAYPANAHNIQRAKSTVYKFEATASTDIHSALKVGLHLVAATKEQTGVNHQPIVIFLTDGEPTIGVTDREQLIQEISEYNSGSRKAPIFALSFGTGSDKKFVQVLSLRNSGFSKHIYEASDASLQLQNFYRLVSSPLLANVSFKYESSVSQVTKTDFPIYFDGAEIVISGCIGVRPIIAPGFSHGVDAWNGHKYRTFHPIMQETPTSIERLWAYLTIKQLLNKKDTSDDKMQEIKMKALDLALKYSFVTDVTSLVVVKPNVTDAVDIESGDDRLGYPMFYKSNCVKPHDLKHFSYIHNSTSREHQTDIFSLLPWLKDFVNQNGILSISKGDYKLGLNETINESITCSKTPLDEVGYCSLLHLCPQVHSYLTGVDVFVKHFCVLKKEYAGVCCSKIL